MISNKKCLITAGPTYEAIDPVRFIGNRSSGKMGIEIAKALLNKNAQVHLILGPSHIEIPDHKNLKITRIESAQEMYEAVMNDIENIDIGIFAAAVADYRVDTIADKKIKKKGNTLTLNLVKTKDILYNVGLQKSETQFLVGFALETNNEVENARKKLEKKNLDMIVLNSLKDKGAGFQHNTNKVTIIDHNNISEYELKSKSDVAIDIVSKIEELLNEK